MINSTERSDILVFNCYLCHVRFLLTCYVCSTKIGEISDISKCFENFVSQALGVLTRIYAAELRYITNSYYLTKTCPQNATGTLGGKKTKIKLPKYLINKLLQVYYVYLYFTIYSLLNWKILITTIPWESPMNMNTIRSKMNTCTHIWKVKYWS